MEVPSGLPLCSVPPVLYNFAMHSRSWILWVMFFFLGAGLLTWHEFVRLPDGRVHVHFLDVGQGDSAFIEGPSGRQIVIDGGPDISTLEGLGEVMPFFDRTIDLLIMTHPHLDHIGSFPEILRRYRVGMVLLTGVMYDNGRYQEFLSLLKAQHIPVEIADPAHDIDLGDRVRLDILWPPPLYYKRSIKNVHESSMVLKLIYGKDSILFAGDAEEPIERKLLAAHADIAADILKIGHHGSKTSTSENFLNAVRPKLAVISVSITNTYGHPHPSVLARLAAHHIPVRRTESGGTVDVELDGKEGLGSGPAAARQSYGR